MKSFISAFLLFLFFINDAYAADGRCDDDFEIGNYELVNKIRLSRTSFEYTYKMEITNTSPTRLKNIMVWVGISGTQTDIQFITNSVKFDSIEKNETKQSLNSFTLQTNRATPLDLNNDLEVAIGCYAPIVFTDTKGNEILFFMNKLYVDFHNDPNNSTFITITDNKNPTNKDLNNFPVITNNFIEIVPLISNFPDYSIDVNYTESPYRVLLFSNGETEWTTFVNHLDKGYIEFKPNPQATEDKIIFALVRRNP